MCAEALVVWNVFLSSKPAKSQVVPYQQVPPPSPPPTRHPTTKFPMQCLHFQKQIVYKLGINYVHLTYRIRIVIFRWQDLQIQFKVLPYGILAWDFLHTCFIKRLLLNRSSTFLCFIVFKKKKKFVCASISARHTFNSKDPKKLIRICFLSSGRWTTRSSCEAGKKSIKPIITWICFLRVV